MSSPRTRVVTKRQLFCFLFGMIIGVGWITASGTWIADAGTFGALAAFAGGAVIMLMIGFCFAELSAMLPDSNGSVAFGFEAFGSSVAYSVGWLLIFVYFVFTAYYVISISWLVAAMGIDVGGSHLYYIDGDPVTVGQVTLGFGFALVVTIANASGASAAARLQDALVLLLVMLVLALGLTALGKGSIGNFKPLFVGENPFMQAKATVLVAATTPLWFSGFDVMPQLMRERRSDVSPRWIGMIITAGTVAALLFYGLVIVSVSSLVEYATLSQSDVPAFDAMLTGSGSEVLAVCVLIAGIFGILSTWNATLLSGSRVLAAMARAGYLPAMLSRASPRTGVPVLAVVVVGMASVPLGLLGRNGADVVIGASATALLCVFAIVVLATIALRRQQPSRERPFRIPGGNAVAWLAFVSTLALIGSSIHESQSMAPGGFPLDLMLLILWGGFGLLCWHLSRKRRETIDEDMRRTIMLSISS